MGRRRVESSPVCAVLSSKTKCREGTTETPDVFKNCPAYKKCNDCPAMIFQ